MSGSSNSLPSLPTCSNTKIPLHYLPEIDRECIASHLDVECAWKMTAEALGMATSQILWISNRRTSRGSETLLLLDDLEKKGVSLNDFIRAVNTSSYKVLPVIDYLNKRYPEIEKKFHDEKTYSRSYPKNLSRSHSYKLESASFKQCKKTHVLLAYHSSDLKQMMNLADCLLKNGFGVSIDRQEELVEGSLTMKDHNLERIHKIFENTADYVLLLVSPSFLRDIDDTGGLTLDGSNPNFGCWYIVKLMKAKLKVGSRRCDRFVAALVKGASAESVPEWMRPVKMYQWPRDYNNLLYFIMDPGRVIKRFVEKQCSTCGSHNSVCQPLACRNRCRGGQRDQLFEPETSGLGSHRHQCKCSSKCPVHRA